MTDKHTTMADKNNNILSAVVVVIVEPLPMATNGRESSCHAVCTSSEKQTRKSF